MLFRFALTFLLATSLSAQQTVDQRVDALLKRMTLDEKIGQLIQYTAGKEELQTHIASGAVGCVFSVGTAEQVNELQRVAIEKSRLKIPLLIAHDVIHGSRTIFPIPLGMAATWDPSSVEEAARIAAREASAIGIRWTFSPMVDIGRDPRWGRVAEGAGEDPYLGSVMAAAYVRGYQGNDLSAPDSILACAKHFAAYGAAEAGRDYNTTDMSERTLREVYLPPFKSAVDAGVWTIMSAFNALNGVPASANRWLLTDVLRNEWKFRGIVDSDYDAIIQLKNHGVAGSDQDAALQAIRAGVDMDMVDATYLTLAEAVRDRSLPQSAIDTAARRILRAKFALGLFENPYADPERARTAVLTPGNLEAARRIATKSIVLLKNDGGILPLSKNIGTLAVIGPLADSQKDLLGSWGAHGREDEVTTLLTAVRTKVSAETKVVVAKGVDVLEGTDEGVAEAVNAAQSSDVVLLVLGERGTMSGEANSRVFLNLPGRQQELLEAVMKVGKPVALVVMAGRPLTIPWAAENVPAIVWPWFAGTQGGPAIADVLFGDVNPAGRLPMSMPRSVGQIPIYYNALPTGRPENPKDHYTSKYIDSPNDPQWPFGYGLSYTTFEYSDLRVSEPKGRGVTVSANVRNSGTRAGDEVVQLYVNDPVASTSRPVRELKGFQRITLAPGESRRIEFTLSESDLTFWGSKGWKFEPGTFRVWIAPNSAAGIEGKFELK
ncbi:MAG TPA: glycoside hydrolase family 3 N-terminal domain-containing protein [Thermoanaerobaculia bacterium]